MKFTVLTLFPDLISQYVGEGVIGRAVKRDLAKVDAVDIRDFTTDRYRTVDDEPFGGGAGMVLKPEPIAKAIESVGSVDLTVELTPSGRPFRQKDAERWSKLNSVVLLCGRYEGIDDRVRERYVDESISIGDYVLSGGELGALVVLDATLRLVPGVLGNADSIRHESFSEGLLEHPHYTRPSVWEGCEVPEVLLSGHHARIEVWRRQQSLLKTARVRPELLEQVSLTVEEKEFLLSELGSEWNEET